jgi:hypothetical protein
MSDTGYDTRIELRHYIEALYNQYVEHHVREHELLSEAAEHARKAMEVRLENMNLFRAQVLEERGLMVTREKHDAIIGSLERRIGTLEKAIANMIGRMVATAAAISIGLIIVGLMLRFVI